MERPNIPAGTHPIEQGHYLLPTKEVLRLMKSISKIVNNRLPGMIVYGKPRLGKTSAVKFAMENLSLMVGAPLPILIANTNWYKVPSEEKFYYDLLQDFRFPFPSKRKPAEMRRQIVNLMLEKAEKSKMRRIVLVMDEAHRLTEFHFNWLMDIYNELDREKISMTVISIGQEELLSRRTFFLEQKKSQIIGRFMTHEHHFMGLRSLDDIRFVLKCYDVPETSSYPKDSDWSYTKYFFPIGYEEGNRLEQEAAHLYQLFVEIRKEHGVSTDFEIPMEYFAFTVETALKMYGAHGDSCRWLTVSQWRECIKLTGYIESEVYMALVHKGAN
ncbi:AAA family ATPase [Paenibacillus chitinolyticus]|nr:AAA family ATPase [Paenibacillus chitinolyticus]MCY9589843.1 TniB family NTP-binding protein [Paenibacillus chitinolyticus]MCY9598156.1 TniB family NTP-binding protein [Paenibacillus chitinolyticus]